MQNIRRSKMSYQRTYDGDFVYQAIERIGFGKFQIFVIASLGLRLFQRGTAGALDSILEPFLLCEMKLSVFDASWIVTAKAIGRIFGAILMGKLSDLYGRKRILLFLFTLETLAYALNALSNGYTMMIATRTVIGVFDPSGTIAVCYIMEIMPSSRRNTLSVFKIFHTAGVLFCMATAMITLRYLNWRWFIVISNCLPLGICSFLVIFLPESPRFLFMTEQHKKAVSVLKKMAEMNKKDVPSFEDYTEEFDLILSKKEITEVLTVDEKTPFMKNTTGESMKTCGSENFKEAEISWCTLFKRFFMNSVLRGVTMILLVLVALGSLQFSGTFTEISNNNKECANVLKYQYIGYLQVGVVLSFPISYLFIGKMPRLLSLKILFCIMILSIIPFYWQIKGWQLIISLFILITIVAIFGMVAFVYEAEVLPTSHRALGLGIANAVGNIGYLVSGVIVDYLYHISRPLSFGLIQGITVMGFIVVFLFAFETKDVPLDEK